VRHSDETVAEYVHLQMDGALVEAGDRVVAGDVIGLSGNTGRSSSPRLHFALRRRDKDGPSVPARFLDVEGDGTPKAEQTVKSANVPVRATPGWRETRNAIDFFRFSQEIEAVGVALPMLEAARRSPPKLKHPSIDLLLAERDQAIEEHKVAAMDEGMRLRAAKEDKDVDALARFATFGPADWADVPSFAKELKAIPAAWSKDPGWAEAVARLAQRTEYRKLVADAVKEEIAASARFGVPKKIDPAARPDYAAAIVAWERARAKAPDPDIGSKIRRRGEALAKARR
jgi:hypothetical protein